MRSTSPLLPGRPWARAALAAALCVWTTGAWPAAGQPIFLTAPSSVQRLAPIRPAAPAAPVAQAPAQAPAPAAAPAAGTVPAPVAAPLAPTEAPRPVTSAYVLRHLTNSVQGFRLTGEIGQSEWPIYVTEAQARQKTVFKVGYLAAISVMPEASFLTVSINDQVIGRANINGARGLRAASFDVPAGLLQPGFNAIRIMAEHRHRVDCSVQATYELWTQIDAAQTGLLLPRADAAVTAITDIAAVPIDDQGAMPIRALTPGRASTRAVERLIRAAQIISISGRFAQPVVDFGPLASGDHGVNLVVGPIGDVAPQIGDLPVGPVTGARVVVLPQTSTRRVTVVATGRDDQEVEEALQQMRVAAVASGSPEGLRAAAAFPGVRLSGGERVRLRDLGLQSQEFSGRFFRAAFNIMLPPDFFAADYAKATLDMAGGYAAGLARDAQMLVSVNGRNAMSLKFANPRGEVFRRSPMPLPLGAMRPGLNRIEIEAHLPAPTDQRCDPLAALNGRKRFLFLDSTELELPRIARIARMPDLSVTTTGAFPYDGSTRRPTLALLSPAREAVSAAATLATQLGIAAGRPIDFRLALAPPPAGEGPSIILAPAAQVDAELAASVGVDHAALTRAWRARIETPATPAPLPRLEALARHRFVLQRNYPAACHLPTPQGGFRKAERMAAMVADPATVASVERPKRDLFEEWDTTLRSRPAWLDAALAAADLARDWLVGHVDRLRLWVDRTPPPPRQLITEKTSLVIAQSLLGDGAADVRTLVVAPDVATLGQAISCLVDPRVWGQVSGRMSALQMSDAEVLSSPSTDATLIQTQPLSIQNVRLVMAGWFSLNTRVYVGIAFVVALLLGAATAGFVRNVGRRNG